MPRRTKAQKAAARERVLADRDAVIERYARGESIRSIARAYDVHAPWLGGRLTRWGIGIREHHTSPMLPAPVHRDPRTGAVTAIHCPAPHCGRITPVTRNRLDEHTTTTTGTRCALSRTPVQDRTRDR
ncbi:hypothetical protein GCM10010387_02700 [Streptomyces inusitatus]|uniref:Uncharacterized protein n=1 Tax=Streptomyces inusitatus TaxID=68221 RepID=A0A918UJC5_9ACTN|nr:hypothetical protein [Streptomyces inusitatus]GGZ14071.1 hypothetical protein GCM10010387_02700 [Streptomyces inusitatus]